MKKLFDFTIIVAIVFVLTHCKKQEKPVVASEEKIHITLDVSGGSKVLINPETGVTAYENGDVVYVANDGIYLGYLTYDHGTFGGDISTPSEDDYLHFYFMGNKTPSETLNNETESLTVDISDQTTAYPEIAYAHSTVKYSSGVSNYHAKLLNKCALVKFVANKATSSVITITGMKNKVSVNLSSNVFTYSKEDDGQIQLASGSDTRWAILLPQDEVTDGGVSVGGFIGTLDTVPQITLNAHVTAGVAITLYAIPEGAICGRFTSNADGDKVHFSKGNLQYYYASSTWKFADNQWGYLGDNGQLEGSIYVWRDLFGWGTSGWNCGNTYYHPEDLSYYSSSASQYGPPGNYNLTGYYAQSDWGVHNSISNGGNQTGIWRTPSKYEWEYIINTRTTESGIRFAQAKVHNVKGFLLLPDDWDASIYQLNNVNTFGSDYDDNVIDSSSWSIMETHGVVFLPAAGERSQGGFINIGLNGYYWTSTCDNDNRAYSFNFGSTIYGNNKCDGHSVRLIHDIE